MAKLGKLLWEKLNDKITQILILFRILRNYQKDKKQTIEIHLLRSSMTLQNYHEKLRRISIHISSKPTLKCRKKAFNLHAIKQKTNKFITFKTLLYISIYNNKVVEWSFAFSPQKTLNYKRIRRGNNLAIPKNAGFFSSEISYQDNRVNKVGECSLVMLFYRLYFVFFPSNYYFIIFVAPLAHQTVDNYRLPCHLASNPGQELWNMKMCFSIGIAISNSLQGAVGSRAWPIFSSDLLPGNLVSMNCNWVETKSQNPTKSKFVLNFPRFFEAVLQ